MKGKDDPLAADILDSCRHLVSIVHTASKTTEKTLGMSSAQHFVLEKLSDGEPRSINQLAALTHTHQSSVSVVVKKLVAKKLIQSLPSEEDARKNVLILTAAGRKLLTKPPQGLLVQDQLLKAVQRLKSEDRKSLSGLLKKLLVELKNADSPAPMFFES